MIELTRGDLLQAQTDTLVNAVNCVGVMGRAIALQFRLAFPENYLAYRSVCKAKTLRPGTLFTFDREPPHHPRYLINLPTKDHFRAPSRMEYIETGLTALVTEIARLDLASIALPALGCGTGGLKWSDVHPRIEAAFAPLPSLHVLLYLPDSAPVDPTAPRP